MIKYQKKAVYIFNKIVKMLLAVLSYTYNNNNSEKVTISKNECYNVEHLGDFFLVSLKLAPENYKSQVI